MHVADIELDLLVEQPPAHAGELAQDVLQRRDRHAQPGELALEVVELLDGALAEFLGEDVLLECVQGVAELVDDRQEVVDHHVQDRVQRGARAVAQQLRFALHPRARSGVAARGAMANGDEVAGSHEHVGLAEADMAVDRLRGVQRDEE